jgi:hypothetical protein
MLRRIALAAVLAMFAAVAVSGLKLASATTGNAVAVDGLVAMSVATNKYVRDAVVVGLKRASVNQSAKATETLRSMGVQ